ALETSDCLLAIGYRPLGVTTGDFSASLPANTIHARGHSVDVGDDNYQAVTLKEVLKGVIDGSSVRCRSLRGSVGQARAEIPAGQSSLGGGLCFAGYLLQARRGACPPPRMRRQNVFVSVNNASPAKARLSSDRLAASGWPVPHASVISTGIKPGRAACRAVGSIPTSIAIPAMATAVMPQSRNAKASGVPSNADIASLSNMPSLGSGCSSGTMAKPGASRRNH